MDLAVKLSISLALGLAGGLTARTKTDVVVMANGDRFTCEIKKLERGVLYACSITWMARSLSSGQK